MVLIHAFEGMIVVRHLLSFLYIDGYKLQLAVYPCPLLLDEYKTLEMPWHNLRNELAKV